jgi:hypothetical protein
MSGLINIDKAFEFIFIYVLSSESQKLNHFLVVLSVANEYSQSNVT